MATQSTGSRHGSWQGPTAGFVGTAVSVHGVPNAAAVASAPTLNTWRSHDSAQALQDPLSAGSNGPYHHDQRIDWPQNTAPSYQQYVTQEQQRQAQYDTASAPQQQSFQQQPLSSTYHSQMGPQGDFPNNISVSSSPSSYQAQNQATFPQPGSFQVASMQVPTSGTEFTPSPHVAMQPPPLPSAPFHSAGENAYEAQAGSHAMQYQEWVFLRFWSV